jgi:hypothetical protein
MKLVACAFSLGVCGHLASAADSARRREPTPINPQSTCGTIKEIYRASQCCGAPDKVTHFSVSPRPNTSLVTGSNPCYGQKPSSNAYFDNTACADTLEQSGTNVTAGYTGDINTSTPVHRAPISSAYWEAGLCPVNVHWHLGTEHLSVGEYDENGRSPHFALNDTYSDPAHRRLAGTRVRKGYSCHKYDSSDTRFTTEYPWKHCVNTHVGETYEIHWPHSAAGACGTPWQYQTPFYDGVFCINNIVSLSPLNTFEKIGVQAQIFTIVNDENYYYPDLIRGMIVNGDYGSDVAYYTGSTTGTSRNNEICSRYTPITWQVDRKCHLISASSFDKMCADMLAQSDDMSPDVAPSGARELVADEYAANQNQR